MPTDPQAPASPNLWQTLLNVPQTVGNNLQRLWGIARQVPTNVEHLVQDPVAYTRQSLANLNAGAGRNLQLLQLLRDPRVPDDVKREIGMKLFMPYVGFSGAGLEAGLEDQVAAVGGEDVLRRFVSPHLADSWFDDYPTVEELANQLHPTLTSQAAQLASDTGSHLGEKMVHQSLEPDEEAQKNKIEQAWRQIMGSDPVPGL